MARRVDQAAAKQARQRKIAIGGFVVLLVVLAISVPRTLKMMNRSQAVATPAAQAANPAPATTSPTATATTAGATPAAPADATLADTGAQPEPGEGQLTAFERFETKDPFAQQAEATPPAASAAAAPAPAKAPAAPARAQAQPAAPALPTPAPTQPATPAPTLPATPAPARAPAPAATPAPKPTSAVIAVNGVRETVAVHTAFPAADKVFELRSIGTNEIKIGIAGGSLTGGAQTVTLKKGKKVTLMNTADGTRYELVLVSLA